MVIVNIFLIWVLYHVCYEKQFIIQNYYSQITISNYMEKRIANHLHKLGIIIDKESIDIGREGRTKIRKYLNCLIASPKADPHSTIYLSGIANWLCNLDTNMMSKRLTIARPIWAYLSCYSQVQLGAGIRILETLS